MLHFKNMVEFVQGIELIYLTIILNSIVCCFFFSCKISQMIGLNLSAQISGFDGTHPGVAIRKFGED